MTTRAGSAQPLHMPSKSALCEKGGLSVPWHVPDNSK